MERRSSIAGAMPRFYAMPARCQAHRAALGWPTRSRARMGKQQQPTEDPSESPVLDYEPRPAESTPVGKVDVWSVTTWLMLTNIAVFLADRYVFGRNRVIAELVGNTLA